MKICNKELEQDLINFRTRLNKHTVYSSTVVEMINLQTEEEQLKFVYELFHRDYDCYRNTLNGFSTELEILALIMGIRAQKLQESHPDYKPILIIDTRAQGFIRMLCDKAFEGGTFRFDTICQLSRYSTHVTACSFFISPRKIECIFLDPSRSEYNTYELQKWETQFKLDGVNFKLHGYQPTPDTSTLQQSIYGCGIYAESLLRKMHRMDFAALTNAIPQGSDLMMLHPCFMKYTQSISVLDSYFEEHKKAQLGMNNKYSYEELEIRYFRESLRTTEKKHLMYSSQNRALDITRLSSVNKAKEFVDTHSDLELINLLNTFVYIPNRS